MGDSKPEKSNKKSDVNLQQVGWMCVIFSSLFHVFSPSFCVIYIHIYIYIYLFVIFILYNIKIDFGTFQEKNKQRSFFHVTTLVVTTW